MLTDLKTPPASSAGKANISLGLLMMAAFMLYGFALIYFRDFAPEKDAWIASYNLSPHFEARLAHVHGNLFSLLNILFGYLLLRLPLGATAARWSSVLARLGLLMPIGILGEMYLGIPFYLVLIGAASMVAATVLLGVSVSRMRMAS